MSRFRTALPRLRGSKALSSISWLLADRIVRLAGGLLVYTLVARSLGPNQFGIFNYAIALAALANVVGAMGLNGIVVRDLVRDQTKANKILGAALCIRFGSGCVGILLMLLILVLVRPGETRLFYTTVLVAISILFRPYEILGFWFESQVDNKRVVLAESTAFMLASALKIALVIKKAPVLAFAAAFSLEAILACAFMWAFFRQTAGVRIESASWPTIKYLLGQAWPLLISGLTLVLYMRIDQIMIGAMLGDTEVGVYSVASKLLEVWFFVPTVICISVFPGIIKAAQTDPQEYADRMVMLYGVLAAIALIVSVLTSAWGTSIIVMLFSQEYAAAGGLLSILMWASAFAFFGFASGRWYINEGLQKIALLRNLFGLMVAIALNLVLIPSWGAKGAAWGTLAAYICSGYLFDATNKRTRVAFRQKTAALLLAPAAKIIRSRFDDR